MSTRPPMPHLKFARHFALALALVAVLVVAAWYLRNAIVQRISGPILGEYGFTITDVSLDALAADAASIGRLELRHTDGMTISVQSLKLPIGADKVGRRTYTAERVTIDWPARAEREPLAPAAILEQVLGLPFRLPKTEVGITLLVIRPYATFDDFAWTTTEARQTVSARAGVARLAAQFETRSDGRHEGQISISTALPDDTETLSVELERSGSGFSVTGTAHIELSSLLALAQSVSPAARAALEPLQIQTSEADLHVRAELPFDPARPTAFGATLSPRLPLELRYAGQTGAPVLVSLRSASPLTLEAQYPEVSWSLSVAEASADMSYAEWSNIGLSAAGLLCRPGPACSMELKLGVADMDLNVARAARFELSSRPEILLFDNSLQMLFDSNTTIRVRGLTLADASIESIDARLVSGGTLATSDAGWRLIAGSLDGRVERLALADGLTLSAPLSLRQLTIADSDGMLTLTGLVNAEPGKASWDMLSLASPSFRGEFSARGKGALTLVGQVDAAPGSATWGEATVALPGVKGKVSLRDDVVAFDLATVGLQPDREALIEGSHDLDASIGKLAVRGAGLSFRSTPAADRMSPWTFGWDIRAGSANADVDLSWAEHTGGWRLQGNAAVTLKNLAGFYEDIVFTGLSTELRAAYGTEAGFDLQPASVSIGLIDVGLPIEKISAQVRLNAEGPSIDVENLHMTVFGGDVRADPFNYDPKRPSNTLLLKAEAIELKRLLTLEEFEAVELSGRVNALLPVIIEGSAVTIGAGRLTGLAPGGVIRYRPDAVPDNAASGMGFVTRALSNFNYETLSSDIDYDKDGNLKLKMQITGRNPDLEEKRPILLNLGIENNVPQMLRSLQAARAVEEVLEKRISK